MSPLYQLIEQISREKGVDAAIIIAALEDAILTAAKKYYRTGRLPAGWKSQLESLPSIFERRLVALPDGYRRGVIGGSLIVYDSQTQTILDTVVLFGR